MPPTPADLPWKTKFLAFIYSLFFDFLCRPDGSINRSLDFLETKTSLSPKKPVHGVKSTDIAVDRTRNLWFRLYNPTSDEHTLPVVFYFHGGGFFSGAPDSKSFDKVCLSLARHLPAVVVSVNYRLAPEHRYPCQYQDCFDVLKFIDSGEVEDFPRCANLKQSFLAGDSAGANVAHHVAVKAGGSESEFSKVELAGMVLIQPFFGGEERTESETRLQRFSFVAIKYSDWMWRSFLPAGSDRDHPACNVFGPNSVVDISKVKFPATIVLAGGLDPLRDWQKRYYKGLKKHGKEAVFVEYPNASHGFYCFDFDRQPESALLIKDVKDFLEKRIRG